MLMNSPIELRLFDFVDEFAREVDTGTREPGEELPKGAQIVVFCQSFFDQLFAKVLKHPITGLDPESKRKAARLAEELKVKGVSPELRRLIVLFEGFCDLYAEVVDGSYGAETITYRQFHEKYMVRLLDRAWTWAVHASYPDLAERIDQARTTYKHAIEAKNW
jgi:hypothetical protein